MMRFSIENAGTNAFFPLSASSVAVVLMTFCAAVCGAWMGWLAGGWLRESERGPTSGKNRIFVSVQSKKWKRRLAAVQWSPPAQTLPQSKMVLRMRLAPCLFGAAAWGGVAWAYGVSLQAGELLLFFAALLTLSCVDVVTRTIPDSCVCFAGVIRAALLALEVILGHIPVSLAIDYCLAGIMTGLLLQGFSSVLGKLRSDTALGGGDVKLMAVVGFHFGLDGAMRIVLLACLGVLLCACVRGLMLENIQLSWKDELGKKVPFGPHISVASIIEVFLESPLLAIGVIA